MWINHFRKVIKSIADLNVISKTIASMPKIILETLILVVALVILSSPDGSGNLTQQIYFLGLSAIRILLWHAEYLTQYQVFS